jgi:hypothetical protein
MSVDEMTVDEMFVDEISVDEVTVHEMLDEISALTPHPFCKLKKYH